MDNALPDYLAMISGAESQWNVFDLSLEICRLVSPDLNRTPYQAQIRWIASRASSRLRDETDSFAIIDAINSVLFEECGFQGNQEDYYNPANSLMSHVMDHRKGIPITLSILYREVAARVGLELDYVGMPGHFLLKYEDSFHQLFIDSFARGEILLADECREMMLDLYQGQLEFRKEFLESIGARAVIARVLLNLKHVYREQGNTALLLRVLDRRIPILEDPLADVLERGLAKIGQEDYRGGLGDLEFFVEHTPDDEIRELVAAQLETVRRFAEGN